MTLAIRIASLEMGTVSTFVGSHIDTTTTGSPATLDIGRGRPHLCPGVYRRGAELESEIVTSQESRIEVDIPDPRPDYRALNQGVARIDCCIPLELDLVEAPPDSVSPQDTVHQRRRRIILTE